MSDHPGSDRPSDTANSSPRPAEGDTLPAPDVAIPLDDAPTRPQGKTGIWEGPLPILDGYEILEVIGQGGTGVVFKARQLRLNRVVALKLLHPGRATAEERLRFLIEAELLARCAHPHVVQVFDTGTYESRTYLALEYVEGGTLASLTRGTPQRPRDAALLVAQIAHGVQHIHDQGVTHRDLKPGNVLLSREESGSAIPKITDFGLARCRDSASDLTRHGAVLGTPAYMAPEQAMGRTDLFGPALDVHALGTILYELLTGRPPFKGANATETLQQVQSHEAVPPRLIVPAVPRDLETVCLRCLEKEPGRRYGSARALADDLERWLRGEPIRARRVGPAERAWRWCKRRPSVAALWGVSVASGLLLVALAWRFTVHLAAAEAHSAAKDAEARALDVEARQAQNRAALHAFYHNFQKVQARRARGRPGWTLDNQEALRDLALAYPQDEDLLTEAAAALGAPDLGRPREVARGFKAHALAFSPDGKTLALAESKAQAWALCSVLLVDPDTGKELRRLSFASDLGWQFTHNVQDGSRTVAFSPDGRWLVVGCRSGRLHRWDLSQPEPVGVGWSGHASEVRAMLFQGTDLYTASTDGTFKRWDSREVWKQSASFSVAPHGLSGLTGSLEGDWVGVVGDGNLRLLDGRDLAPRGPVMPSGARGVSLSPDGRVLFLAGDEQTLALDAVHRRPLRRALLPLADHGQLSAPREFLLSPDGTLAACSCDNSKHVHLWDLASSRELLDINIGGGLLALAFHPGSRLLAVTGDRKTLLFPLHGLTATAAIHPGRIGDFTWTAEGLWALAESPRGRSELVNWQRSQPRPIDRHGLPSHSDCRVALAADPNSGWLCVRLNDKTVQLWNNKSRQQVDLAVHRAEVSRFGPDGRLWVLSGPAVRVYTVPDGKEVASWSNALADKLTGKGTLWALAVGTQGTLVGSREGLLRLLEPDATLRQSWALSQSPITSVALSSDESLAAVGTWAGELIVVRLADGLVLARAAGHEDPVDDVLWAGDDLILTASADRSVRLWRPPNGDGPLQPLFQLPQPGPVRRIALSPDGTTLAVGILGERGLRFWPLDGLHDRLAELGFTPGFTVTPRPSAAALSLHPPTGLRLDVFEGTNFERLVKTVHRPGVSSVPDSSVPADAYSLRWKGHLRAPKPGKYRLVLDGTSPAQLWLDEKLLIDGQGKREVEVTLGAAPASLRLDFRATEPDASCKLLYDTVPPSGKLRRVPAEWLRP